MLSCLSFQSAISLKVAAPRQHAKSILHKTRIPRFWGCISYQRHISFVLIPQFWGKKMEESFPPHTSATGFSIKICWSAGVQPISWPKSHWGHAYSSAWPLQPTRSHKHAIPQKESFPEYDTVHRDFRQRFWSSIPNHFQGPLHVQEIIASSRTVLRHEDGLTL